MPRRSGELKPRWCLHCVLSFFCGRGLLVCAPPLILSDGCSANSFVRFPLRAVGSSLCARGQCQVAGGGVNACVCVYLSGLWFVGVLFAVVSSPHKFQSWFLILCGRRWLVYAQGVFEVNRDSVDVRVGFLSFGQLVCGLQRFEFDGRR